MVLEYITIIERTNTTYPTSLVDALQSGWVPDPVLMPSGRPNVVEGVGAIYHLVKGEKAEIAEYVRRASPQAVTDAALAELKKPADEFPGIDGTLSLAHGVEPPSDRAWRVYKVYEKAVIWLREKKKEASA